MKRSIAARFRARLDQRKESRRYRTWQRVLHVAAGAVVVLLALILFPRPELYVPPDFPREGNIATHDIIAPFDYPVLKSEAELQEERRRVERETPPVLAYDRTVADSVRRTVTAFFDYAERLASASISAHLRSERLAQEFPWLDQTDLPPPRAGGGWLALRYAVEDVVRRVYTAGIFPDNRFLPSSQSQFVMVVRPELGDFPLKRDQILDLEGARRRFVDELAEIPGVDSLEQQRLVQLSEDLLAANLSYDHETTEQRRQESLAEIRPYKIRIFRGERIVAKNERVTAAHAERLAALAQVRAEQRDDRNPFAHLLPVGARILFSAFCVIAVVVHFAHFRPRYMRRTAVILLLAVVWSAVLVATRYAAAAGGPALYLIPIPFAAIVTTILLDLGTGLVSTAFLSMLVGVVTGFDFTVFFVGLSAGMVSSYSVRTVRRRYDFYRPALYGALTLVAAITLVEALRYSSPQTILAGAGYGIVNAVASAILAVGVLPVFESLFGFTTDLTLLELSNLNHPILRRLSLEAPGTYHHSIVIGNLAEAAAEAIGANPLLARVGAYYHDIGKLEKPEYFAENLPHFKNKHEKLNPSMSALILESHVKGGRELALQHDLPDAVIDFIEQHHGTTTMSFFYHKARMMSPAEPVPEVEYRYPGPRPQSRETAIVMLADSAEAVSRTLEDPKPGRLHSAIKKVIENKFLAGQLEECNLTLKDLHKIEE
ncbi:MAG TPA: HDIG domain-containing protein, partial [Acidobacteriota bacterium]|nr:HDIG domain-containing protein [Acidobacteriota bacterium]